MYLSLYTNRKHSPLLHQSHENQTVSLHLPHFLLLKLQFHQIVSSIMQNIINKADYLSLSMNPNQKYGSIYKFLIPTITATSLKSKKQSIYCIRHNYLSYLSHPHKLKAHIFNWLQVFFI